MPSDSSVKTYRLLSDDHVYKTIDWHYMHDVLQRNRMAPSGAVIQRNPFGSGLIFVWRTTKEFQHAHSSGNLFSETYRALKKYSCQLIPVMPVTRNYVLGAFDLIALLDDTGTVVRGRCHYFAFPTPVKHPRRNLAFQVWSYYP